MIILVLSSTYQYLSFFNESLYKEILLCSEVYTDVPEHFLLIYTSFHLLHLCLLRFVICQIFHFCDTATFLCIAVNALEILFLYFRETFVKIEFKKM